MQPVIAVTDSLLALCRSMQETGQTCGRECRLRLLAVRLLLRSVHKGSNYFVALA